jgi:hypothetical protein
MALISQSDLEARLGRSLTAEESSAFTIINNALQSEVEALIGSDVESVSASTRYFNGGVQHLRIDPCTSITAVTQVDDDDTVIYTYVTSDYVKEPKNRTVQTMLIHRNSCGFITGIKNIAVTAKFSIYEDTDTLNIVKDALIEALIAEIENNDDIQSESIEGYSVTYGTTQSKELFSTVKYLFPQV